MSRLFSGRQNGSPVSCECRAITNRRCGETGLVVAYKFGGDLKFNHGSSRPYRRPEHRNADGLSACGHAWQFSGTRAVAQLADGDRITLSGLILRRLAINPRVHKLRLSFLKCDSVRTPCHVVTLARRSDISAVLLLGKDKRYSLPTIEKKCYNLLDYDVPDNFGRNRVRQLFILMRQTNSALQLRVAAVLTVLSAQGLIVGESSDPGRHLLQSCVLLNALSLAREAHLVACTCQERPSKLGPHVYSD